MAFSSRCSSCGLLGLTVRDATGAGRVCVECVAAREFVPGPRRRLRGFLSWRIRRDDHEDDNATSENTPAPEHEVPHGPGIRVLGREGRRQHQATATAQAIVGHEQRERSSTSEVAPPLA